MIDECASIVGLERLRCLHVNDSARWRSARTATATRRWPRASSGARGLSAFLSEPRFEGLPALLETKLDAEQIAIAKDLRKKGLAARKRRKSRKGGR